MKSIREINTEIPEGKLLMMALACLTVSPAISINGEIREGTKMTPDEMLIEISKVADKIYTNEKYISS